MRINAIIAWKTGRLFIWFHSSLSAREFQRNLNDILSADPVWPQEEGSASFVRQRPGVRVDARVSGLALESTLETALEQALEQTLERAGMVWPACPGLSIRIMMKNYSKVLLDSNIYVYAGNSNLIMSR